MRIIKKSKVKYVKDNYIKQRSVIYTLLKGEMSLAERYQFSSFGASVVAI